MNDYLGIDTSNYTTSAAILSGDKIESLKRPLPVKEGEKGLRQSDAVFHHTRALPELLEEILPNRSVKAIGVSYRPRNIEGSYMPCFSVGDGTARSLSALCGAPLYKTSHQVGHILAALYSCGKLDLLKADKPFIAFHISGGTTDCLLVEPDDEEIIVCREIASSLDLKAGQAVDRVGLMLGLKFPCGPGLEELAKESDRKFRIKPAMRGGNCSFSGIENICAKMLKDGEPGCDIALFCIKYIEAAILKTAEYALGQFGNLPMVFAGGVMSNGIIKETVQRRFDSAYFAEPAFSADNACGLAVFASIKDGCM